MKTPSVRTRFASQSVRISQPKTEEGWRPSTNEKWGFALGVALVVLAIISIVVLVG